MKLRKAIKFAIAGAIVGATPILAHAAQPAAMGSYTADTDNNITYSCASGFTCATADAVSEAGFYMVTVTDGSGDTFIDTIVYDDAAADGEGIMSAQNVVGHETNAVLNNGIYAKTLVTEAQDAGLGITANFSSGVTISTGAYGQTVADADGSGTFGGVQDVVLSQSITTNDGNFSAGFDWTHGDVVGTTDAYETFNITGLNGDAGNTMTGTFLLKETKIDGSDAFGYARKQLSATQDIEDAIGVTDEAYTQYFISNEASGAAVGTGVMIADGSSNTIAFSANETVVALTIDQTVDGADANFSLSDLHNESTGFGDGVDQHGASSGSAITVIMSPTTAADPFINF